MDLSKLGFPKEIVLAIEEHKDLEIDKYSHKGGNGYVVFGFHKLLTKRIALKFYYYGSGPHEEVQLLSRLDSDNVVRILDARTISNGYAYFMTEEIIGGDVDNLISSPFISLRLAVEVTRGILNGVGDMHKDKNRLLHRDLKPANILIDKNYKPLIADFGSVKRIPEGQEHVSGSKHAALYRPPESYYNEYGKKSDIYQVGLVFYQLLGGYLPYEGEAYLKQSELRKYHSLTSDFDKSKFIDAVLEKKAKKGKLIDLNSLPPFVDNKVKRIIRSATNPDPNKRYNNVAQFDHALHKLGTLPDWQFQDGHFRLFDFKGKNYRVIHKKKGKFICEKSKTDSDNWRKEGKIASGNPREVVENIITQVIKK